MGPAGPKILFATVIAFLVGAVFYITAPERDVRGSSVSSVSAVPVSSNPGHNRSNHLIYLVSDTRIPYWRIMGRGIENAAETYGYALSIYDSGNDPKKELEHAVQAIRENATGIVVSPTTSSACATILKLAKKANIPVVIADIGTDGGDYVSYIASDNKDGAYRIGQVLTRALKDTGRHSGRVGIIAIPQKRLNGQARTAGFMQALEEAGFKGAGIKQQSSFSYRETYDYTRELIAETPDLRAIWLQGSDRYRGALDAIADAGKKNDILLVTFDAEPEFLRLIPEGVLLGSAMQQPYLMGQEAVATLDRHLRGFPVEKNRLLPVLAVSAENIAQELPTIRRNVLGIEGKSE